MGRVAFKLLFRMTVSRQAPQDLLPVVVVAVHLHVLDAQPATLERLHARVVDKGDHLGGTFSAAAEVCFVVRVAAAGVAITTPAPGGVSLQLGFGLQFIRLVEDETSRSAVSIYSAVSPWTTRSRPSSGSVRSTLKAQPRSRRGEFTNWNAREK